MNRIAIIDLGSNSIRFIIMEISKDGVYRLIYQEKKPIRLAEGMTLKSPLLTEHAQERALHCLQVYRHIADAYQVTKIIAVATAAVRNAHNGSSFLKKSSFSHSHSHDNRQWETRGSFRIYRCTSYDSHV